MKRKAFVLISLLLCAALLAGCAAVSAEPKPAAEPAESAPEATAATEAASTPEPPSTVPDPTAEPAEQSEGPGDNGLIELLNGVFDNYHFGTAGSSLTAAWYAASIVAWGMEHGPEAVAAAASGWDRGLVNEYGEDLTEKLTSLYSVAMSFYGAGAAVLEDCGWQGDWTLAGSDVQGVFQALFPALGMETPLVAAVYAPDAEAEHLRAWGMTLTEEDMADPVKALNALLVGQAIPEGAAVLSESLSGGVLTLDMNRAFGDYLRSMGTSGELLTVSAVVNTALSLIDGAESVLLTVEGQTLETGHEIYTDPISFYEE